MGDVTSIDVARARRDRAAVTASGGLPLAGRRLYTTREVARHLRVAERSVTRWASKGMPSYPIGRKHRRYDLDEVTAWCARQRDDSETA